MQNRKEEKHQALISCEMLMKLHEYSIRNAGALELSPPSPTPLYSLKGGSTPSSVNIHSTQAHEGFLPPFTPSFSAVRPKPLSNYLSTALPSCLFTSLIYSPSILRSGLRHVVNNEIRKVTPTTVPPSTPHTTCCTLRRRCGKVNILLVFRDVSHPLNWWNLFYKSHLSPATNTKVSSSSSFTFPYSGPRFLSLTNLHQPPPPPPASHRCA